MNDNNTLPELEREWREGVTRNIQDLAQAQRVTQEAVQALKAEMMPRTEVRDALKGVVGTDVYSADKAASEMRFQRLESGPMRAREWIVAALSAIAVLVSVTIGCGGMLVSVVMWVLSHAVFH